MGKKVVAFSLYGTNKMYQDGAIENAKLVKKYYPDWECRFYISQEVASETIELLQENNAKVIHKVREDEVDGTFWRFMPMSEEDVEILIVRDADSRISLREVYAVEEWINSAKKCHIMRDNPGHVILIPAGMFGMRGGVIPNIEKLIKEWKTRRKKQGLGWADSYGLDQLFLAQEIYPKIKSSVLIHSELVKFRGETVCSFPTQRINNEFVGEAITFEDTDMNNINFEKLKLRTYPHSIFYYNSFFMKLLQILKTILKKRAK